MISREQALALKAHMVTASGAILRDRTTAIEIQAIGAAFDAARLLYPSVGLPSGTSFVHTFATTLGPVIYENPAIEDDPVGCSDEIVHECQHVHQWHTAATPKIRQDHLIWPSEVAFPILYLKEPQAMAQWEADAYAAGSSVRFRLAGNMRSPEEIAALLVANYKGSAEAAQLALGMMKSHELTIRSTGRVNVWAAQIAHDFLDSLGVPAVYQT